MNLHSNYRAARKPPITSSDQQGVGLIEVLVAVLVLAVGILGLAGMQLTAKRAGH